ncbi:MAG: UDP-N-acetylmuramate--L-alanine ligase [Ruminococcaceae bacterium]|nr:UDP-N-acetylmuramate--L-alanine ligase [Oscillospiraceae bacterium]
MATENTHYGAERIAAMLTGCESIYFIGIGGINMSSLAHITHTRGYRVGGSDRTATSLTERLAREGITVFYAHAAAHVDDYDAVVYTVAISPDNPEYLRAIERGIPCISRADYLGYLMMGYRRRIGVSGMHGKSSCTSMCAEVLLAANTEPTVLSGAELAAMDGAYHVGGTENFVFEACEYMDSFLDFNPTVAVILNIEMDHVDYFKSMEQIRTSFSRFAALTGEAGYAVYNGDDAEVLAALSDYRGDRLSFGMTGENLSYRAENIRTENGCPSFDVIKKGTFLCRVCLSVTGYHHIYNALACTAVCDLCGLSPAEITEGLARFGGAKRRMERKGTLNGAAVYDDYGHHPTEIRTTLEGAKKAVAKDGRLFCVYQPHTYSRTAALLDGFVSSLAVADRVLMVDIYAARETDTLGVSSALVAQRIGKKATCPATFAAAAEQLKKEVTAKDTVIIMGAGDVYKVFDYLGDARDAMDAPCFSFEKEK